MSNLSAAIEALAPQLTTRVLDEMYADPFWTARFGARGRRHAEADSRYHISYLSEALRSGDARILIRYACWLRSVLVSRGMASTHLAENFERLAHAIGEQLAEAHPAIELLREACAALRYDQGPAHWLEQREAALRAAVCAELAEPGARLSEWFAHLVDAVAAERGELFLEHVRWLGEYRRERGEPGVLGAELDALRAVIGRSCELRAPDREQLLSLLHSGAQLHRQRNARTSEP